VRAPHQKCHQSPICYPYQEISDIHRNVVKSQSIASEVQRDVMKNATRSKNRGDEGGQSQVVSENSSSITERTANRR
jgi:hypothetical protein